MAEVRLCHLYPGELNIYADRGNIAVLRRRLEWRGHALRVLEAGVGDPVPADADMYYLGGGQDRDQLVVAGDLPRTKADAMRSAIADGAAVLAVCGGFQLAGHGYTAVDGSRMPGIALLDADTVAGTTRLIGDLVIDAELDGTTRRVVGFENHAGRTTLGAGSRPLGRVVEGHGNNDADGGEGAVTGRVVGTYLHGTGGRVPLEGLPDDLEDAAHRAAVARANVRR
jgi:CobQ-like glutamine amidotransferase family enzyme